MKIPRFLFPFTVSSNERTRAFTKESELAAVFCLAELERSKGGGIIRKKQAEELLFIAEVCYPLLLAPWERKALLFDGFGILAHTLSYDALPDVNSFLDEMETSMHSRDVYYASLCKNANYFCAFKGKEEKKIDGLIINSDLISYISEIQEIREPILDKAFLIPTFDESFISSSIQELLSLKLTLKDELRDLRRSMKLLSAITWRYVKSISKEIKQTREEYRNKVAEVKVSILEKLREIRKEYDEKILLVSKLYAEKLQNLNQERGELDKTMQNLTSRMERCRAEIKYCQLQRYETGEKSWREELEKVKKELKKLNKSIKDADEKIRELESSKKLEVSKYASEYDHHAENAMREVDALEALRDSKIKTKQQEIKSLEDVTAKIIYQINKLHEIKEKAYNELKKLGIMGIGKKRAIIYLSFYLVCYKSESKKRYLAYPPSEVAELKVSTKFKSLLGSKIKSLLEPRSRQMMGFFNRFISVLENNPAFEKDVNEAGVSINILGTKESKEKIIKGLQELKSEGWISEREFKVFNNALTNF